MSFAFYSRAFDLFVYISHVISLHKIGVKNNEKHRVETKKRLAVRIFNSDVSSSIKLEMNVAIKPWRFRANGELTKSEEAFETNVLLVPREILKI